MNTRPPAVDRRGFAITVVLLVTVVSVLAFLFSTATLTIASRSSAAQERNATQALLAADSGLRTLGARGTVTPYASSYGSFEAWIEGNFATLDLGDGVQAVLEVVDETADSVTVQSTGTSGTSRRVVVQAFEIVIGPPVPASVNVPGALTSVGSIDSNSNPDVIGRANTDDAWTYSDVLLCSAQRGEYVDYNGGVWRVDSDADCSGSMALTRVDGVTDSATLPGGSTTVDHRPTAITETLPYDAVTNRSEVRVTAGTASLFGMGSPISIGDYSGKVVGVAEETDEGVTHSVLTIDWSTPGPPPSGVTREGSVVRRGVSSAVTNGLCDIDAKKAAESFPNGCVPSQDLSELFLKTFGVADPQFLYDSLPASQRLTGSDITASRELSGITWVTNPDNNFRDQNGSGILIIENNPGQQLTLNVSNSFTGLIYVIGDAKIAGNGEYSENAIVVDGVLSLDVAVQGTTYIAYDPLAIMRAIAGITFPNPEPGGLGAALANTWRVR